MISPTTSPQYFGSGTTTTGTTGRKDIGKDAFLKLLVQQLKHQDPLEPLKPEEFAAQLAQFSSVEQLTQLNAAVNAQTQASAMGQLVQQTALSASLMGKEVLANGDQVSVPVSGAARVTVEVAGTGGAGTLTLKNDAGAVIATRQIGQVTPGVRELTLPADLPPGTWHYSVDVKDSSGVTKAATTYTSGVVTSLEFKNGSIVLHIGDAEIALTDLIRIAPAPTAAATGSHAVASAAGAAGSALAGTARMLGGALHLLPGLPIF
jgi:flagellar basal-body rod modification protein FlgD